MAGRWTPVLLTLLLTLLLLTGSASFSESAAAPPRMRPYSGIGVLFLPAASSESEQELVLYQEPGVMRLGRISGPIQTGYQWLFGKQSGRNPLIVMARKGNWLRVCYDDAGHEGWLDPGRHDTFQPWEPYLKRTVIHLLSGLRPQYYQLYHQPGQNLGGTLSPRQLLRVVSMDDDWVMVLTDQALIGWLRWRDEDGRLTIGL
jgi:hypothetical protein